MFVDGGKMQLWPNGSLTFELKSWLHGTALIGVVLHDDGGTELSGSNCSMMHNFSLHAANSYVNFSLGSNDTARSVAHTLGVDPALVLVQGSWMQILGVGFSETLGYQARLNDAFSGQVLWSETRVKNLKNVPDFSCDDTVIVLGLDYPLDNQFELEGALQKIVSPPNVPMLAHGTELIHFDVRPLRW